MQEFLTVTVLNEYITTLLDSDPMLQGVWVKGEISGFRLYQQSGHMYFTLKDGDSAISCVMFRSRAQRLNFMPEDGMEVLLLGSISVFAKQGKYQLYAETIQPFGAGALFQYLEKLKKQLEARGYFALENKKPIPAAARRVGVVTSQDGAALRDILKVLKQRQPGTEVVIVHSSVQGMDAPRELVAGLKSLNEYGEVDLIIIGRGGGSLEDLMAFNSEEVVQAIYESKIPIISAVGHEVDISLADLAADMRAATPTQAAQFAVPDSAIMQRELENLKRKLLRIMERNVSERAEMLDRLMMKRLWRNPQLILEKRNAALQEKNQCLQKAMQEVLMARKHGLALAAAGLDNLSPLRVMARGYAILSQDERVVKSIDQLKLGEKLNARLIDGNVSLEIKAKEKING